jgi:TonB family protein
MPRIVAMLTALAVMAGLAPAPAASQTAPPVPAPPAPPQPKPPGTHLQPLNPGSWVTNDDYPAQAIREGQKGTTAFRLNVDETGAVTECVVTGSSGAPTLDDATCALLKVRAKFRPALDAQGKPIPATYFNRFRWELPIPELQPFASWTSILRVTIGTGGEIVSCKQQAFGPVPEGAKQGCDWLASATREETRNVRGSATGPVTILFRTDQLVSGMPAPAEPAAFASFKRVWGMKMRREIEPSGFPAACYVDWGQGETVIPATKCLNMGRYVAGTEWHTITSTNAMLTDGDSNVGEALNTLTRRMSK